MFDFCLSIFPFDSTAITVTTTVWVGVWVIVFFNLRLGWTLSGLVVPGYLVPLLITRPTTAMVVIFEAALTYLIVRALSDWPRLASFWSSFFGRDRFFVIVVVSVLVRALFDGWILPMTGKFLVEEIGIQFDYRNSLHSFGLIVVALIANYFWKPGLKRGMIPISISIGTTYLIINYLFVGFTNFNLGNFHLLYEDVSTSLLASPKAYIIVITTAYLASWINLRYAWDFNGILIPALLGLLWHDPTKILVSVVECSVLFFAGSYLLNTRLFQNKTVEGGRKLLFFFTLCFFYRLVLCHTLPNLLPGIELTDTFGFGYMLTTLMAVKAHDKNLSIRMLKGTLQVSMLGAVAGSLIGFAFYCAPPINFTVATTPVVHERPYEPSLGFTNDPLIELIRHDKVHFYQKRIPDSYGPPVASEISIFRSAITELGRVGPSDKVELAHIADHLSQINYQLILVSDRYYYLREQLPSNGWGVYVIDTQHRDGICLEVPSPLDEWATIETGLCMLKNFECAGLAIAGTPRDVNLGGEADVLAANQTLFSVFHQIFGKHQPVQLRGFTRSFLRKNKTAGTPGIAEDTSISQVKSQLWIRGSLPNSLDLSKLKSLIGGFDVHWNNSPTSNHLRDSNRGQFAELVLSRRDRRAMVAYTILDDSHTTPSNPFEVTPIQQHLGAWLRSVKKTHICNQGSEGYQPATTEQMLYMDQEVITPLMDVTSMISEQNSDTPFWEDKNVAEHLKAIDATARVLGYQLQIITDPQSSQSFIALSESDPMNLRGWGIFVFRPGLASPYVVEVPRPRFENRSLDFGISLFDRTHASILMVAGAHPRANRDGSADISKAANKTNLFNLCRHVIFRQKADQPQLIIQARAIQAPVDADIVIATDDGVRDPSRLTPLKKKLLKNFDEENLRSTFVDGRANTAGYEIGILMQAAAVQVSANKEVISLWLSPSLRSKYREQTADDSLSSQFHACGLPTRHCSLWEGINESHDLPPDSQPTQIPRELRSHLERYVQHFDIIELHSIVQHYPEWQFVRILDTESAQAYLLISNNDKQPPAIMNLTGSFNQQTYNPLRLSRETVSQFIRSQALWLEGAQQ